jgi:hypothetical protein
VNIEIALDDPRAYDTRPDTATPGKLYASRNGSVFLALCPTSDGLPQLALLREGHDSAGTLFYACPWPGLRLREIQGTLTVNL